jgi:peroxiredoxin Q/BCP
MAAPIEVGRKAPAFSLQDQDGRTHRLKDYEGRPLVLYFYPKDDTPGCTREACAFRDSLSDLGKTKASVLGVSVLDVASKAKFAKKHGLTFPLLADPDHEVADKFGAWKKKSLYGKTYMGVARMTYLIGPDGKVTRRWDDVKVDGHANDVLAAVREL